MKSPAGSAPTVAASATRSPSRAAATAVIAAEPPTTSEMLRDELLLLAELGRHVVAEHEHVRIAVADDQQVERRGPGPLPVTRSRDHHFDPGFAEPGRRLGRQARVGHEHVDIARGADAGERPPADLRAVRDDDDLHGLARHQLVGAGLALMLCHGTRDRVDGVNAQERDVDAHPFQHAGGQRPGELI